MKLQNKDSIEISHYLKFHPEFAEIARRFDTKFKACNAAAHLPWDGTMEGHRIRQGILDSCRESERVATREYEEALKSAGFRDSYALQRRIFWLLESADKKAEKSQKIRGLLE
jgi:hypothetical protein